MASATHETMEVTTNRDVTPEQLAAELAVTDTSPATDEQPAKPAATAKPAEPPVETPDSADAEDTDAEPDPASEAGKKLAGKRKSLQKRIDELTWRNHQEAARREELEKQVEALKAPKPVEKKADDGRPRLTQFTARIGTDFETYEDAVDAHTDALADWKLTARDQASVAAQQRTARDQALHQHHIRGMDAHADFDAVLGQFVQHGGRFAPMTPQEANGPLGDLEQTILHAPNGHEIAYALAKEPEIYHRLIAAPTRIAFMTEMGQLITRLAAAPSGSAAKPAPVSKAKPPVPPLQSSPVAADQDPDEMPFGPTYVRVMNKKHGK